MFDHEKLDVYQLELQFIRWLTVLISEIKTNARKTHTIIAEVCDQLDRGSLSSLLNTAEGNGKRQLPVRAKYFDDARGSAAECAACLDALVAKEACTAERVQEGKQMLARIVAMLTKLVDRFSVPGGLREEPAQYGAMLEAEPALPGCSSLSSCSPSPSFSSSPSSSSPSKRRTPARGHRKQTKNDVEDEDEKEKEIENEDEDEYIGPRHG
jgi:four helix bundle protein